MKWIYIYSITSAVRNMIYLHIALVAPLLCQGKKSCLTRWVFHWSTKSQVYNAIQKKSYAAKILIKCCCKSENGQGCCSLSMVDCDGKRSVVVAVVEVTLLQSFPRCPFTVMWLQWAVHSVLVAASEWLPVPLSQVLMALSPSQLLKTATIREEQRKVHSLK